MKDNPSSIAELFQKTARPTTRESEPEEGLPPNGAPYTAFSRRSNKPEFTLHFITPAGTIRSFQYAHLDSASIFTAERIELCFMGLKPMQVLIHGRNMREHYNYIHEHRITWVREAARGFVGGDEPIVTKVIIAQTKEDAEKREEN